MYRASTWPQLMHAVVIAHRAGRSGFECTPMSTSKHCSPHYTCVGANTKASPLLYESSRFEFTWDRSVSVALVVVGQGLGNLVDRLFFPFLGEAVKLGQKDACNMDVRVISQPAHSIEMWCIMHLLALLPTSPCSHQRQISMDPRNPVQRKPS